MESPLFLLDLLTGHEPKMHKSLQIKGRFFRFMGSSPGIHAAWAAVGTGTKSMISSKIAGTVFLRSRLSARMISR